MGRLFVQYLAVAAGAINKADVNTTPTDWIPIATVKTVIVDNKNSIKLTLIPIDFANSLLKDINLKYLKNKITISNMISDKNTNTLISSFDIVAAFPNKKSFKPDWFPLVELEIKERSTDPIAKKKVETNSWFFIFISIINEY